MVGFLLVDSHLQDHRAVGCPRVRTRGPDDQMVVFLLVEILRGRTQDPLLGRRHTRVRHQAKYLQLQIHGQLPEPELT